MNFNGRPTYNQVAVLRREGDVTLSDEVVALSNFPSPVAARLTSYTSNGYFFRDKSVDIKRTRQNCGVYLHGDTLPYYGRLIDIIRVTYALNIEYVLFRCEWAHPSTGVKLDPFQLPLVNFGKLLYPHDRLEDEPFILATQAQQVWYNADPSGHGWLTVGEVESKAYAHVDDENVDDDNVDDDNADPSKLY